MISNVAASVCISFLLVMANVSVALSQVPLAQVPLAAVRFEQIEEVLSDFAETQHLYVQGEIGISPEQLAALETWLDENGPHWTVVLMQRGAAQHYSAPDGRVFSGMDAVEFALGHGLANRTRFGRLEHPKTGETDGAAFVLFLEDRKFSYYASEAQDRRGIGEAQWIGNLDRNARVAMQSGGRIIDAVKHTVNDINNRLRQAIANEEQAERERIEQAERVKQERQRAVAQVRSDIQETRSKLLPEVQTVATNFLTNFPEASASLMARPPLSEWKAELENIESGLNEDSSREMAQAVSMTTANIHRQLDYYAAHTAFEQTIAPLQQRWQGLTLHSYYAAAELPVQSAQKLLRQARSEHLSGNPAFIETINGIRKALDLGDSAINVAIRDVEQDAVRKQAIRRTMLTLLSIIFALSASLLLFLHRRRRPALAAAHQLFSASQQQFQTLQTSIDAVLVRKKAILGTLEQFAKRGKTGETLQVAKRIETDCEVIQTMTNAAKQVFINVEGLIYPSSLGAQGINLFSPARYLEGLNLLGSKVFEVSHKDSITFDTGPFKTGPFKTGTPDTVPEPPSHHATFDNFVSDLGKRRESTEQELDQLEHCSRMVVPTLDNLEKKYVSLGELTHALKAEASKDGFFMVPNLEAELLPSAHRLIARGRKMSEIDPVHVVNTICPEANRQIVDANEAIAFVNEIRTQQFPIFDDVGDKLKALNHRVKWIEEHVISMGNRISQLMHDACEHEMQGVLKQLKADANVFLTKLHGIMQVAEVTINERRAEVKMTRQSLAEARANVAKALSIQTSEAISEESLNPDEHLTSAESAVKAAIVAIDMGNLDGAVRAAMSAQEEASYAQSLVDDSLQSLNEFSVRYPQSCAELKESMKTLADVQQIIKSAEQTYALTAMIWHDEPEKENDSTDSQDDEAAWESAPYASGEPISMQVESAERILESIRSGLASAPAEHASGKLREAANILRFAAEGTSESNKRLILAKNHCKRLDALVPTNIRRAEALITELEKLNAFVEDPRAETSTQQTHKQLQSQHQQLANDLRTPQVGRDPFQDSDQLLKHRIALIELRSLINADFTAFKEAKLAVEGARREIKAVARLAMQSIEDEVPDSAEIARCQNETRRLSPLVTAAEVALQVAHNDWQAIQKTASDATAELGVVSGSLSQELRAAHEAALGIATASSEVLRASRWTGTYGITISGQPGSHELEEARNALASGDYAATMSLCGDAVSAVAAAISAAEDEVASRRRQKEVAAARRRTLQESLFSASSGSSFGSSNSSWSSSSSSGSSFSSSSSSSSSSSGGSSGFSRSGW